jgi:plasmid maintenance system antidote protein VapI
MLLGVTRQALTNLVNEKAGISPGDVHTAFESVRLQPQAWVAGG